MSEDAKKHKRGKLHKTTASGVDVGNLSWDWTQPLQRLLKNPDRSLMDRLSLVMFDTEMLLDRDKAVKNWLPDDYENFMLLRYSAVVERAKKKAGIEKLEDIHLADENDEQTALFLDELREEAAQMLSKLKNSRYMQAAAELMPLKGIYLDPAQDPDFINTPERAEVLSVKQQAVLLFFAAHTDKTPSGSADLTDEELSKLRSTFEQLDQYYFDCTGGGEIETTEQMFLDFIEQETPNAGQIITALPQLQAILPKKHTMPNNKLANTLTKDIINAGAFDLIVGQSRNRDITSYVMATMEETPAVKMTGKPYTQYDRSVMDAIVSQWLYGDQSHIVTPDMIYRTMNNKTKAEFVSPQQKTAVTKSIEKMRNIHVTIDASEEIRKCKATDADGNLVTSFKVNDTLLSARQVEVKAGGKTVKAYRINAEPILLTYSRLNKQLLTIPAKYLDVREVDAAGNITSISIPDTEQHIPIRDYLLRRIAVMKNDRKNTHQTQSSRILFDTLFAETGTLSSSRTTNNRNRDYVFQVLDFLKASSFIAGYKIIKEGRKIYAVDIEI